MEKLSQPDGFANSHLFVYGTLRKGFRAHGLLQQLHARFLASGHIQGRLYNLGEYPGAVESSIRSECVAGEIYFLPRPAMAFGVLDRFEGYNAANPAFNQFERRMATVSATDGGEGSAWVYWLAQRRILGRRIPSGNYALSRRR